MRDVELTVEHGEMQWSAGTTWWRATRPLTPPASKRTPVVAIHGGPGFTHDYIRAFSELAADGRTVYHYDQIGGGRSTHFDAGNVPALDDELFETELRQLVDHLGISDDFALVGNSWGGMLAAQFATTRPAGLRCVVISNSPASIPLWVAGIAELREEAAPEVRDVLAHHEDAGTTDSAEYIAAMDVFNREHLCRAVPWPDDLWVSFAYIDRDPTVYRVTLGPTDHVIVGTFKDWDITDRLGDITVPALVIRGRHDEATESAVKPFVELIPDATAVTFEQSSHTPHLEEPVDFFRVVGNFLRSHDWPFRAAVR